MTNKFSRDYKAVALDLDGTLLNSRRFIPKAHRDILRELDSKGIEIIIATGRGLSSALKVTKNLNFHYTIVSNNGAIAMDENRKVLFSQTIENEILDFIRESFSGILRGPFVHIDDEEVFLLVPEDSDDSYPDYSVEKPSQWDTLENHPVQDNILSIVLFGKEEELRPNLELIKKFPQVTTHISHAFEKGEVLLEVQHKLAEKYLGIEHLLEIKNLTLDDCVAIGDDNNDLSMITECGFGIVMKNGTDLMKSKADYITKFTNDEDGVEKVLRKVFKFE